MDYNNFNGTGYGMSKQIDENGTKLISKVMFFVSLFDLAIGICLALFSENISAFDATFVGINMVFLFVILFLITLATLFSAKERKKPAFRIVCTVLLSVDIYIFVTYQICYHIDAEDRVGVGSKLGIFGFTLAWLIPGIYVLILYGRDKKRCARCCCEIMALCQSVDMMRMNMAHNREIITGIDADVNKTSVFTPTYVYMYNGYEYRTTLDHFYGNLNADFEEGKMQKIYINPQNPNEVMMENTPDVMKLIFGFGALFFAIIGLIVFIVAMTKGLEFTSNTYY